MGHCWKRFPLGSNLRPAPKGLHSKHELLQSTESHDLTVSCLFPSNTGFKCGGSMSAISVNSVRCSASYGNSGK
jgi:hypothetical protein